MDLRVDDKVALITGASSGFGAHFAKTLTGAGAKVALAARRVDRLEALVGELTASGATAIAVPMDVTDTASIETGVAAAVDQLGGLDILVNNAGVARSGAVADLSEADWDFVLDTNLKGAVMVAKAAANAMIEAGKGGSIINIASLLSTRVMAGVVGYCASKAGLMRASEVMALEFAKHSIRVNSIAPGYVETDLNRAFLRSDAGQSMMKGIPQRRFGAPGDLDGALMLLASDAGAFMTGSTIQVDGGHALVIPGR